MEEVIISLVIAAITGGAAFIFSEHKSKGRSEEMSKNIEKTQDELKKKVEKLEQNDQLCEIIKVKHEGLEKLVEAIKEDKASKESVEAMRREFESVMENFTHRFDRLEELMRSFFGKK